MSVSDAQRRTLEILIADDDAGDRRQVRRALLQSGLAYECTETASIAEALEACSRQGFDCAFVDYRLPGHDGLEGISALRERCPDMALVMCTGQGSELIATEAMKRGASDYLPKANADAASVRRVVENALEKLALQRRIAQHRAELESFARVLVHDLKQPVSAIHGMAFLIEKAVRSGTADGGETIRHCRSVISSAKHMNALIDALHQYTQADEPAPFAPVDMNEAMRDTLANLSSLIEKRGARVTHDALPTVTGSAAQLAQLLQNLIANGIKYCEADVPSVHVAASWQADGMWLFCVRDNGIGIPEPHLEDIFEPFKRLHGSSKYEGTGLGLATCRKIVQRHGGVIACRSEAGAGATFSFTLPGAAKTC